MIANRSSRNLARMAAGILAAAAGLLASMQALAAVDIQHWQTSTGADVYFVENHDLPIIDLSVNFAAGSARDDATTSGLASLTRYMMTLGAGGLTDAQISSRIADVGAVMSGEVDQDRAHFDLRTLSSKQEREQALDIYAKVLQKPDFPAEVLTREKARIVAGLNDAATQPESIASKAFMAAVYGQHPYALDSNGEPETVSALKRDDLVQFYQRHYGAKGAVIAMIGDMQRDEAERIAERLAGGLPAAAKPAISSSSARPIPAARSRTSTAAPRRRAGA